MSERYIPTRYPYTYAADFMRINPHIIPSDVYDLAEREERQREGEYFGTLLSRAQASRIRRLWAERTGQKDEDLARKHADAYLIGHGIEKTD